MQLVVRLVLVVVAGAITWGCNDVTGRADRADAAAPLAPLEGSAAVGSVASRRAGAGGMSAAWGVSVACAGDVDGDGIGDVLLGAPQESGVAAGAGAAALVLGPIVAGLDALTPDALMTGVEAGDGAGVSVASAGDVDGDGFGDVVIGAWQRNGVARDTGAAYLLRGPIDGTVALGPEHIVLEGDAPDAYAGFAVAGAGDVNGDGLADVLVSSFHARERGAVGLLLGPVRRGPVLLGDADAVIRGERDGEHAGIAVAAAGDVDGDGYGDVLVGAPFEDSGGEDAGAVYLLRGPLRAEVSLHDAEAKLVGESGGDQAGTSLAAAGDVNGDGVMDFVIGAPFADRGGTDAGAAYLVLGPIRGVVSLADAAAIFVGEAAGDGAGVAVSGVPDIDADGRAELLIGAWGADFAGDGAGAAYLVAGADARGVFPLGRATARLLGEAAQDGIGGSVAGCDVDGDGRGDLLIGAYGYDGESSNSGAVFIVGSAGRAP